jgi:hypothetical protein
MRCLSKNGGGIEQGLELLSDPSRAAECAEWELHARECAGCRQLLSAWKALGEFEAPEVSADFDQRLYARIAQERAPWFRLKKSLWPAGPIAWWKPAIPLAACAALAVALLLRGSGPGPGVVDKGVAEQPVNMEQVEQVLQDLDLLAPVPPGTRPAEL